MKKIRGEDMKNYQLFVVPIGNANITENRVFHRRPSATISPTVV